MLGSKHHIHDVIGKAFHFNVDLQLHSQLLEGIRGVSMGVKFPVHAWNSICLTLDKIVKLTYIGELPDPLYVIPTMAYSQHIERLHRSIIIELSCVEPDTVMS